MDSNFIYNKVLEKYKDDEFNSHYLKRYFNFLNLCIRLNKANKPDYIENHHILPRAQWKEYANVTVNEWNTIALSARQHIIAHWILAKCFGGSMWLSVWCFISGFDHGYRKDRVPHNWINSRKVEEVRKRCVNEASVRSKKMWQNPEIRSKLLIHLAGENNPFYSKTHTDATKKYMSEIKSGENHPFYGMKRPEHAKLMSGMLKGIPKSDEHKKGISKSHNKIYTCPHCGKTGGRLLLRWHFEHCYIIDKTKKLYRAVDPNNNEHIFGSVNIFAEDMGLSAKAIATTLKNNLKKYEIGKKATVISDKARNTVGWSFEVIR